MSSHDKYLWQKETLTLKFNFLYVSKYPPFNRKLRSWTSFADFF